MKKNPFPFLELTDLPRLPIPPLKDTLDRYLFQVRPLLTDEEFATTKAKVESFLVTDGPQLHQELQSLSKETPTSWLEGFWDTMYLEYRGPAPINTNPSFLFHETPDMTQIGRAAHLINSSCRFIKALHSNKIPVDMERGNPMCMSQYWRFFGSSRIPRSVRDEIVTHPFSDHIVVMYKNHFFELKVFVNQQIVSVESLKANLQSIISTPPDQLALSSGEREGGVGIFTTGDRDIWTSVRSELEGNPTNHRSLQVIDSALFVICLDDHTSSSITDLSKQMLHSNDGQNRWFDKLMIIITPDGKAAWNMEHAPYDGHTLLVITNYIYDDILGKPLPGFDALTNDVALPTSYSATHLRWVVGESVMRRMENAKRAYVAFVRSTDTSVLMFSEFGSRTISKQFGVSPDAFVQMAFQLAYYRLKNRVGSTYESANTKGFYHGRTETIRSVSSKSKLFCEEFVKNMIVSGGGSNNNNNSSVSDNGKDKVVNALRDAISQHVETAKLAKTGKGVDRHLYGMFWLAKHRRQKFPNYEIPEIFTDRAYSTFTSSILSTSNCGGVALDLFAFGPVVDNGFGLGYIIKENSVHVNVTNFHGEAYAYSSMLERSLLDMSQLLLYGKSKERLPAKL